MYCPKCGNDMDYTGWFNLYGGGDYICKTCKQKVTVLFEDLGDKEDECEIEDNQNCDFL